MPGKRNPAPGSRNRGRPEWFVLGKPHGDRAKQFKPFAALRGYDEMVDMVIERSQSKPEAPADLSEIVDRILYGGMPDFGIDADPEFDLKADGVCDPGFDPETDEAPDPGLNSESGRDYDPEFGFEPDRIPDPAFDFDPDGLPESTAEERTGPSPDRMPALSGCGCISPNGDEGHKVVYGAISIGDDDVP